MRRNSHHEAPPLPDLGNGPTMRPGEIHESRRYMLITPLFGGGVQPGIHDAVTPIRGSAVRGHLRFWWRATRGGSFDGDLGLMKAYEDWLWGAPARGKNQGGGQSRVRLHIQDVRLGDKLYQGSVPREHRDTPYVVTERPNYPGQYITRTNRASVSPGYGAFPLQPSNDEAYDIGERDSQDRDLKYTLRNLAFTLHISYPADMAKEVEAALWAWQTFGGIGARTRRGFGALHYLDGSPPPVHDVTVWLEQQLVHHVVEGRWPEHVAHLPRTSTQLKVLAPRSPSQPHIVWGDLLERLKRFRQQRLDTPLPPPSTARRPGRNHWPEPDAIRRLTNTRQRPRHEEDLTTFNKFPRAAFGLPIIFHFQKAGQGDPVDTTLQARIPQKSALDGSIKHSDRFASPLLLRPLLCKNNEAVGLAVVLANAAVPDFLGLLAGTRLLNQEPLRHQLSPDEAAAIQNVSTRRPLLGHHTDVLQAFLETL